ncbi:MAG: septation ring formation regulator EzrA [Bacilli bacterium]|nr:septation ring formation regulator EzrA [Bacilli bacterium]
MGTGAIIGLVAGIVVGLVGIGFILYFFVFREKVFKKQLREIDRKFQYLHALLIGQDAQYVKRLEIISRTNLLYVEIHTKYLKKFKEIRDKHDANAQSALNNLRDLLDVKNFKAFKETMLHVNEIVEGYDKEVQALNVELLRVVKPEEDCRQSSLTYKESLRRIKQDYYSKESELVMMSNSFEEVFKYIDQLFEDFEGLVESAQYDEANQILPKIDEILHELTKNMQDLPSLCTMVSIVIPEKIISVENAYKDLVNDKFPLYHLCVVQTLTEMKEQIENFTHRIRLFEINGIGEKLESMSEKLDKFFDLFEEEKVARESFEANNENVYSTVNLIERKFIKLRNTIPEVSKVFVINEAHQNKINDIQNDINKVGALKRSLDTFIHSATKQPYSLLVNKMNELSTASNSIISDIDEYNNYISSLKSDAESAYNVVYAFYDKVKRAEQQVREINVAKCTEKYSPKFEKLYELLNSINNLLIHSPIDVDQVNKLQRDLFEISNDLLDDGEVAQDYSMMILAENAILYANRHRYHLSDIDQLINLAETDFVNGDFEHASISTSNALKKIKQENGK